MSARKSCYENMFISLLRGDSMVVHMPLIRTESIHGLDLELNKPINSYIYKTRKAIGLWLESLLHWKVALHYHYIISMLSSLHH